ncbi:MAG: 6-phosphofructokinase [Myxococcales bacterium]|nr:6-phosphofructokinase [Myxococcales bacterium]
MAAVKRVAVLTSGGDAPGMNAAIRAATLIGHAAGVEVFGVERGYRGLLEDAITPLPPGEVSGILREGGTILGSARCKEFHQREVRDQARKNLAARGIDGLIVIGGNGSLTGAMHLTAEEERGAQPLAVIGIPASIDNDLALTSMSIGVDTAMNTIVEACDKIADTATAHDRTFLIEVMGRDCGYLAMTSAIAAGADLALFPEAGRTDAAIVDSIVDAVLAARRRARRGRRVLVIKAEGVAIPMDRLKSMVDVRLREREPNADPAAIETRVTVLGHVVRGGRPSAFDRLLGSRLANVGIRALLAGETRKMAAWMPPVDVAAEVGVRSPADPYCWLTDLTAVLAETDRLLKGSSALARWRAAVFNDIDQAMTL